EQSRDVSSSPPFRSPEYRRIGRRVARTAPEHRRLVPSTRAHRSFGEPLRPCKREDRRLYRPAHQSPVELFRFSRLSSLDVPELLAQVLVPAVWEYRDDNTGVGAAGNLQSRRESSARRHPYEQTLFASEPSRAIVSRFRPDLQVFVRQFRVVDAGHDRRRHVLQPFKTVKRRVRLERNDPDFGVQFLEPTPDSYKSAACAQSRDKMSYTAACLLPDFQGGTLVVSLPVCRIVVLIRVEVLVRVLGIQPSSLTDSPVGAFERRSKYKVGPVSSQNSLSFLAGILRQRESDFVALRSADPGVGDAGVPRRCVQDGLAGHECPSTLAVQDHVKRRPVLDRAPGVEPFSLCVDFDRLQVPG